MVDVYAITFWIVFCVYHVHNTMPCLLITIDTFYLYYKEKLQNPRKKRLIVYKDHQTLIHRISYIISSIPMTERHIPLYL